MVKLSKKRDRCLHGVSVQKQLSFLPQIVCCKLP